MGGSGMSTAAQTVARIRDELHEATFGVRLALPLTWHGEAAARFGEQVEEVLADVALAVESLTMSIPLIYAHEERMRILRQAMGGG